MVNYCRLKSRFYWFRTADTVMGMDYLKPSNCRRDNSCWKTITSNDFLTACRYCKWNARGCSPKKESGKRSSGYAVKMIVKTWPGVGLARGFEGDTGLVVGNLSRYVQCTRLNLERFQGSVPVELFGRIKFPEVGDSQYFISLGPYDFYWLALEKPEGAELAADWPTLKTRGSWESLLAPGQRRSLAQALIRYASQRRWFRGKARDRKNVSITDIVRLDGEARFAIALLHVEYGHGAPETYFIPLAFAEDAEPHESMATPSPVIAQP